ncbi:MAG: GTPase Era [Nitrospirota bacterium]|nr:GTPase Era [Nitrospirota bacterium]
MKFGTMAIVGCPNVGKSTLVNTIVKQKIAIVSDKPQTTRSRILGVAHFPEGQLALLDTPGLHRPWHQLNKRMVQAALDTVHDADLLAVMVDGRQKPGAGDREVIEQVFSLTDRSKNKPAFLLVNKIDLMSKPKMLPVIEAYQQLGEWSEIVPLSAKTGLNVDRLRDLVFAQLSEHEGAYEEDFVTDQSLRCLAAEIVREKVLEQTRKELPYAVAVKIDEFKEKGRLFLIAASIVVEKTGQKAIVIGKSGQRLKEIGTAARLDLEREMCVKVFLDLHVKVRGAWRDNEQMLIELGY